MLAAYLHGRASLALAPGAPLSAGSRRGDGGARASRLWPEGGDPAAEAAPGVPGGLSSSAARGPVASAGPSARGPRQVGGRARPSEEPLRRSAMAAMAAAPASPSPLDACCRRERKAGGAARPHRCACSGGATTSGCRAQHPVFHSQHAWASLPSGGLDAISCDVMRRDTEQLLCL